MIGFCREFASDFRPRAAVNAGALAPGGSSILAPGDVMAPVAPSRAKGVRPSGISPLAINSPPMRTERRLERFLAPCGRVLGTLGAGARRGRRHDRRRAAGGAHARMRGGSPPSSPRRSSAFFLVRCRWGRWCSSGSSRLLLAGAYGDGSKAVEGMLSGYADATVWLVASAFLLSGTVVRTGFGRRIALLLIRSLGRTTLGPGIRDRRFGTAARARSFRRTRRAAAR